MEDYGGGGDFVTKKKGLIKFSLPEFFLNKTIQYSCHMTEKEGGEF